MSIRLQNQAWREVKTDTAAEMLLLIACTDIADDEGNSIWASDEYLSWKTGISLRTIQAIKKKWREAGVLIPRGLFNLETKEQVFQDDMDVSRGTGGRGWVVLYQVRLGALAAKTPWKVATAATFTEGRKDHVERSQPEAQKVATAAQEGRNLAQRNKEDPSVDPSGNPLGERGVKTAIADALAVKSPPFQDSFTGKNKTKKPEHPELEACCKVLWQDFIGANPEEKLDWHRGVEGPVKKLLAEIPSMTAAKLKEYCANRRTTPGTRQAELPKLYLCSITNYKINWSIGYGHEALAQKVAEELCIHGRGSIEAIDGAIEFCIRYERKTADQAVDFLITKAKKEITYGVAPNRFWFDERKWRV